MAAELPTILHYVYMAWPEQTGYTIRSHAIASNQRQLGYRVGVCRGLGNYTRAKSDFCGAEPQTEHGGVSYFWHAPEIQPRSPFYSMLRKLSQRPVRGTGQVRTWIDTPGYADWIRKQWCTPDIIHAHSPAATGVTGARIARRFKASCIYEVRGFWHLSEATEHGRSIQMKDAVSQDVEAAMVSDHVIAICRGIADALVQHGVPASKVSVVPNGVNMADFMPGQYNDQLAAALNLTGRFVYGYATNVRRLEGVQDVVRAWPLIKQAVPEAAFLLVGDGSYMDSLRRIVRESGVGDDWRLVGRVPHSQIQEYYSLFDAFVVPRISEPVCEIVTPLKPLEAMAMGVPVIASNVSALREMVHDGETGLLFDAGSPDSLADVCAQMANDNSLKEDLGRSAREWVRNERNWHVLAKRYAPVYDSCLGRQL